MKNKKLFNILKPVTFVVILTLGLFPSALAYGEDTTIVSISAPSNVSSGQEFTVSVVVEPGTAIAGVQFNLSFDESLVTADSTVEGNLLSQEGADTYFNPGEINNTVGEINGVAGAIITPNGTISTTGTFATIILTAGTEEGTCPLTLSGVIVGDSSGHSVPVNIVSGQVGINVQTTINQPPVLDTIGNKSVDETETLMFTVSATDPDSDPLTFSASNLPEGSVFNTGTRTFSWTPGLGQEGTYYNVLFEVSDGELTDSEGITITVNIPNPPGGGGGGDVSNDNPSGGGSSGVDDYPEEPSGEPEQQDETPPVVNNVSTSGVTSNSVVINWTTTEPSTSQVEYWASPSQFSPLDETMVTEHVVYLTDLKPGTNYHYRTFSEDGAGNLTVSEAYDFTTPSVTATFTVNWLSISPSEADTGEEVTISALITNTSDITGSYEVILSIDDVMEATKNVVDLASGASQEVTFTTIRETIGTYSVNINGTTGSFVVSERDITEGAIASFDVIPHYETDTGVITFTRIEYEINESYQSALFSQPGTELVLKVSLNNTSLEEITVLSSEPESNTGYLDYVPDNGWESGTYTFQLELRAGDGVIETSPGENLILTSAAVAKVVSWATLGAIIGGVLLLALLSVILLLHRKRDMLRA